MRNWIQEYICNPLLSSAEHRLLSFVCVLLVPEYVLAWVIGQYLKARKIVSVHKGELCTLNKTLDILIHSYIKDALRRLHPLLSWEAFISFRVLRKERVTMPNTPLISRKTMFRFIRSPLAISIITQPSTLTSRLQHRPSRKSRTGERTTGSLNPLSYSKRPGS